jgi:hypothetical protein
VAQALPALSISASERAFRDASEAFATLTLPGRLTLELIVSAVEAIRGRRIRIRSTDRLIGTSICGLWLPGKKHEWVFHPPTPWELQRQQFVLHELAHMILGHDAHPGAGALLHQGLQNLSPELVRKALMRTEFGTVEEATAEYLADLMAGAIRETTGEPGAFEEVFG